MSDETSEGARIGPPRVLIAELTHRCPLRCAYCSNPEQLVRSPAELRTELWQDVMRQAAALGVYQVHMTGGEPLLRDDLEPIVASAADSGLYPTLITSGLGTNRAREQLPLLAKSGVKAVQVSFQDTDAAMAAAVCGRDAFVEKSAFARRVVELGLSLTVNVVLHRQNVARIASFIELARELGADRLELAHVQYQGWAFQNRHALLPSAGQVAEADRVVAHAKLMHTARLQILYVMPDLHSGRPKPCMGGWGRRALVVNPRGEVLPCHGASILPLVHDRVPERGLREIWQRGAAFEAFRGRAWMEEPCRTCPERERDYGGCRCQALAFSGRPTAPDPACARVRDHTKVVTLRQRAPAPNATIPYRLRTPS